MHVCVRLQVSVVKGMSLTWKGTWNDADVLFFINDTFKNSKYSTQKSNFSEVKAVPIVVLIIVALGTLINFEGVVH